MSVIINPAPLVTGSNIARVQSKTATTGATDSSSFNLVFDATLTPGNIVVLSVGSSVSSIRNIAGTGLTFTWLSSTANNAAVSMLGIGRVFSGATATLTVTYGAVSTISIVGVEYSGASLLRIDKQTTAIGSSTSPASGATSNTAVANELWVGAIGSRGQLINTLSSPTNSFSIVDQIGSTFNTANTDRSAALLERIVTSTGTANAGGTLAQNNNWAAIVATLEETPGGAGIFY